MTVSQLRNSNSLDDWYKKALSFKRSRKKVIKEFGGRKSLENLRNGRKKLVLDILR